MSYLFFRHKETIQSSFDLLGEMVKFSYDACRQMDSILNTETKLKKAMIMVNNNLIDSNMFIRAMVLAAGHFITAGGETAEFVKQSRLMKHYRDFDKHVKFVLHLVSILKVTDLTQENVSCLNTSLVTVFYNLILFSIFKSCLYIHFLSSPSFSMHNFFFYPYPSFFV